MSFFASLHLKVLGGMSVVRIFSVLAFIIFGGCASVSLSSYLEPENGTVYYLPKSILTVTVRQMEDLARGRIWYELGASPFSADGSIDTTKIKDLIPSETIPDPHHRYTLKYNPSAFSDDRFCITRSTTGLLKDVQFVADDRTPQIVFNLARFIAGTLPKPAGATFTEDRDEKKVVVRRQYVGRVDPFDPSDVEAFNTALENYLGDGVEIDFTRMIETVKSSVTSWPEGCSVKDNCPRRAWQQRCRQDQICYRTKLTLPVDLKHRHRTVDVNYADVINVLEIGAISVERAFLVQKLSGFTFDNGTLVSAVIRKPSEVEELSLLPLNVVNAALSVPTGLLATAFGGSDADKVAMLERISNLEGQVQTLNKNADLLAISTGADIRPNEVEKTYSLTCGGGTDKGIFGWSVPLTAQ